MLRKERLSASRAIGLLVILLFAGTILATPMGASGSPADAQTADEGTQSDNRGDSPSTGDDRKPSERQDPDASPAEPGGKPDGGDGEPAEDPAAGKDGEDARQDSARAPGDGETGMTTHVSAESNTRGIVGEVFANSINYMAKRAEQGDEEAELPSLAEYPLDPHERDYYGDSPRVRPLREDGGDEAYLVYRDSILVVPEDEAGEFDVTMSEDGKTAFVSPAPADSRIAGKTGIAFLGENIGEDTVIMFGDEPSVDGDGSLSVPLKDTGDVYLSELFSDGKFEMSFQEAPKSPARLMAGRGLFDKEVSGTNWSGHLTNFSPGRLGAGLEMNPWKLRFGLQLHIAANVDFEITSTGATGTLETQDIASIRIPVEVFTIEIAYRFQAQFDEHPVHVKGSLTSEMDYSITTHGTEIRNFRTPVCFSAINIAPGHENKDVHFYIGTMFAIDTGLFGIKIDLWITTIKVGPVLRLDQRSRGGVHVTARMDRDMFDKDNPNRSDASIHTCCANGSPGCLSADVREVANQYIDLTLDLYFKKWSFRLSDDGEHAVGTKSFYDSKTHGGGLQEGVCPHRLFNVPVATWRVGPVDNPSQPAGADLRVSLNDVDAIADPVERDLAQGITDDNGRTSVFLPYAQGKRHLITASGTLDIDGEQIEVVGTSAQPTPMKMGRNDVTNIVLEEGRDSAIHVTKIWEVDIEGHEVPERLQALVIRRDPGVAAPTPGDDTDAIPNGWVPVDILNLERDGERDTVWDAISWQPKYCLGNAATSKPYAYEYAVRELNKGYTENPIPMVGSLRDYYPDDYLEDPLLSEEELTRRRKDVWRHAVMTAEERDGSQPTITCEIPQYETSVGDVILAHDRCYRVTYEEEPSDYGYHFTITNLAEQCVNLTKRWVVTKPDTVIPDGVYITALWKPVTGWEELAEERGVPTTWVPVIRPLAGPTTTLSDLMFDGTLNAFDAHGIDDVPLAITRVTADPHLSNWHAAYDIPKYRNGIPMQVMGSELDTTAISNLLMYEYDLSLPVRVKTPPGFISFPETATGDTEMFLQASILNTDTDPMHTIAGMKIWDNSVLHPLPEWLKIGIWDDDKKIGEVTLNESEHHESNVWPWVFCSEDVNPDKTYRLVETYPDGYSEAGNWFPIVTDHRIENRYAVPDGVKIRIKVQFDQSCPPENPHGVELQLRDRDGNPLRYGDGTPVPNVTALPENKYMVEVPGWFAHDADFMGYQIVQTNLNTFDPHHDGDQADFYQDFYSAPVLSFDRGIVALPDTPIYTYTVNNLAQTDMLFPADKTWTGDSPSDRPNNIRLTLYQDGLEVNSREVTDDGTGTWFALMHQAPDGTDLHLPRVSPKGTLHVYTLAEEHVDGYWTTIEKGITDAYANRFHVTNEKIGDRGVTLRGTVRWEGDEGKEHMRPDSVHVVATAHGETMASADVPVSDGTWELRDLPCYEKDGTPLQYSVLENHVSGYRTKYETPSFDATLRTWTCDLTNKLVGYFPFTVRKRIDGPPEAKKTSEAFSFSMFPENRLVDIDDWEIPFPIQEGGLVIRGEGEGKFEIPIDQEGLYLYTLTEEPGTNGLWKYDSTRYSVLVVALEGEDGIMQYRSWVSDEGGIGFEAFDYGDTATTGGDTPGGDPAPTPGGDTGDLPPAPAAYDITIRYMDVATGRELSHATETATPGMGAAIIVAAPDAITSDGTEYVRLAGQEQVFSHEYDDAARRYTFFYRAANDTLHADMSVPPVVDAGENDELPMTETDSVGFTNVYGRSYTVRKEWDFKGQDETKPSSVRMQLQRLEDNDGKPEWVAVETIELNEASGWKGTFSPVLPAEEDEEAAREDDGEVPGMPPAGTAGSPGNQPDYPSQWEVDPDGAIADAMDRRYRVRELSEDGTPLRAEDDSDNADHRQPDFIATVTRDGKQEERGFIVSYDTDDGETIVTNTLGKIFRAQKEWDIDAAKKDKPQSVKAQLQKREKKPEGEGQEGDAERKWQKFDEAELSEANEWTARFRLVPFDEKDEDCRIRELDRSGKPVLEKGDPDLAGSDDDKKKYVPTVIYDVSGGEEDGGHETKYLVSYKVDAEKRTTTVTNKAVMDVSLYKRWLMFGDTNKPESVYLMLLGRPKTQEGGEATHYLPVNDVLYGDKLDASGVADIAGLKDKIESISSIATGDKDKFMQNIQEYTKIELAIKKVNGEKDGHGKEWHAQFGVPKYDAAGLEREFVGAELVTGLMKIGTDVMTGTDFPVMIQPIPQVYFTVFGYAFNIFADYELTGNVINTWFKGNVDPEPPNPPNPPVPPVPPVPPLPPIPPIPPVPPIPPIPTPTPIPDPDPDDPKSIGRPIVGSKFWVGDDEDERPDEVKVHVYAHDGDSKWEVRGSPVTARASDGWAWMLYLPPGDPAIDKRITVDEEVPYGYAAKYVGYDIINTKIPSNKRTLRGSKTWNDADNQDGKRPGKITIRLLADGQEVANKDVTEKDGWKWEFRDFPAEKDGRKIAYSVSEDAVEGYDQHISGMNVTNTHAPETLSIHVRKVWDDNNDQDRKRPGSVRVRLRIDGTAVATSDLSTGNQWEHSFDGLAKYWKGKEINYSLTEDVVPEYSTEVTGSAEDGFVVTNSYTPGKVQVHVTKVWSDDDNRDGIRPDSVKVGLMSGDTAIGAPVVLSAENNWETTFKGLDYKHEGQIVPYSVIEEHDQVITGTDGPGTYGHEVYEDAEGGYSYGILNFHTPETVTVSGTKTWEDDDDELGLRPAAIVVRLLADGRQIDSRTVTEQDGWIWKFAGLHKYEGGRRIEYAVEESEVGGYRSAVEGYDIANWPIRDFANYRVETYYQVDGKYPDAPDKADVRNDQVGAKVRVTADDLESGRDRYTLDVDAPNVTEGTVAERGDLVLRLHFRPSFVITYDPNGGAFADGTETPVDEEHLYGDIIYIRDAPTRKGFRFLYWKGSEYLPGDEYVVKGDHTFVAQWEPIDDEVVPPPPSLTPPSSRVPPGNPKVPVTRTNLPQLGDTAPPAIAVALAVAAGILALSKGIRGARKE